MSTHKRDDAGGALIIAFAAAVAWLTSVERNLVSNPQDWLRKPRISKFQTDLKAVISMLTAEAASFAKTDIPLSYAEGATGKAHTFSWTANHRTSVEQIARDSYVYILDATRYIGDADKRIVGNVLRSEVFEVLLSSRTARQGGARIADQIRSQAGLSHILYKNGARMPVDAYAQMVARTQSALAYNYGEIIQSVGEGFVYLEVFDGSGCGWVEHRDPDTANGKIVTAWEAAANPIAHPSCVRAFAPAEKQKPTRFSKTEQYELVKEAARNTQGAGAKAMSAAAGSAFARGPIERRSRMLANRRVRYPAVRDSI